MILLLLLIRILTPTLFTGEPVEAASVCERALRLAPDDPSVSLAQAEHAHRIADSTPEGRARRAAYAAAAELYERAGGAATARRSALLRRLARCEDEQGRARRLGRTLSLVRSPHEPRLGSFHILRNLPRSSRAMSRTQLHR